MYFFYRIIIKKKLIMKRNSFLIKIVYELKHLKLQKKKKQSALRFPHLLFHMIRST